MGRWDSLRGCLNRPMRKIAFPGVLEVSPVVPLSLTASGGAHVVRTPYPELLEQVGKLLLRDFSAFAVLQPRPFFVLDQFGDHGGGRHALGAEGLKGGPDVRKQLDADRRVEGVVNLLNGPSRSLRLWLPSATYSLRDPKQQSPVGADPVVESDRAFRLGP